MLIISGQTATGKTNYALDLALKNNGQLINFDSRQIYKKLDIITGKDLPKNCQFYLEEKNNNYEIGYYLITYKNKKIKLWLYDIAYPNQYFSSFNFVKLAKVVINKIKKENKTPIFVGGTYFYLKHLIYGFDYQAPADLKLREELNKKSIDQLQKILLSFNKNIKKDFNQSDWLNPRRLIRRIEILKANKKPQKKKTNLFKNLKIIGLFFKDKNQLKEKITQRVLNRLENGAINEVKNLLKQGYKKTDPGLKTIGYQQIIDFLENKIDKEKMIESWINAEVNYAKRQLTFMKKDKNIEMRFI